MFCSNKTFEEFESELVYLKEKKNKKNKLFCKKRLANAWICKAFNPKKGW